MDIKKVPTTEDLYKLYLMYEKNKKISK